MTRLSNGFSRKRANLRAALALYFAYYNFCRMHKSIRMTPAMAAGDHPEALGDGGSAGGCAGSCSSRVPWSLVISFRPTYPSAFFSSATNASC